MPEATNLSVHFIEADGTVRSVSGKAGQTLMQLARSNHVCGLYADCGGSLSCATCRVQLVDDWQHRFPNMSDMEDMLLDLTSDRTDTTRLSCQLILTDDHDGLMVRINPRQGMDF